MKTVWLCFIAVAGLHLNAIAGEPLVIATHKGARLERTIAGGLARFGSHTHARVGESGCVQLQKGLLLVSSEARFLRQAAIKVEVANRAITVRGTALIAASPGGAVKITCLHGNVKVGAAAEEAGLEAGELLVGSAQGHSARARIELAPLLKSCALLGAGFAPLANAVKIARMSERQAKGLQKEAAQGALVAANQEGFLPDQPNASGAPVMAALTHSARDGQMAAVSSSDVVYAGAAATNMGMLMEWSSFDFPSGFDIDPGAGGSAGDGAAGSNGSGAGAP